MTGLVAGGLVAVVAGGGIAGLASAVALAQAGWRVTVLERAPEFGEVGAGLGFTGNGMAALHALGVAEAVRAAGRRLLTSWPRPVPALPAGHRGSGTLSPPPPPGG